MESTGIAVTEQSACVLTCLDAVDDVREECRDVLPHSHVGYHLGFVRVCCNKSVSEMPCSVMHVELCIGGAATTAPPAVAVAFTILSRNSTHFLHCIPLAVALR